jgi:hypothetical protein
MAGREDEGDTGMLGGLIFGLTSAIVSIFVLIDLVLNQSIYTRSYLMGAPFFIGLNLVVTVLFTQATLKGDYRWYLMIAPAITLVMLLWLFHGLSPLWRTLGLASLAFLGLVIVWVDWLRSPRGRSPNP